MFALSLTACSEFTCDWDPFVEDCVDEFDPPIQYKANKMAIRFDEVGPTKECFKDSLNYFQDHAHDYYNFKKNKVTNYLEGWHMVFVLNVMDCETLKNGAIVQIKCNGFTDHTRSTMGVRLIDGSFHHSAFYHELGHVLHRVRGVSSDYDHKDKQLWDMTDKLAEEFWATNFDRCETHLPEEAVNHEALSVDANNISKCILYSDH